MTLLAEPHSNAIAPKPKRNILEITPYKPGESKLAAKDGTDQSARLEVLALSANEGALGASSLVAPAIAKTPLHAYPDAQCTALRQALSSAYELPAQQLVCSAGSDQIIALLVQAYAGTGDEVLYSQHGFSMYRIAALANNAQPIAAPEQNLCADPQALLAAITDKTKLVFLANPNNPTGSYLTRSQLASLHQALPKHVILVIDAAYSEFAMQSPEYSTGHELVAQGHANVIVTHTFSKLYGLASLRLGWCYGAEAIIDVLNRVRDPFNVSAQAQAAGIAALADKQHSQAVIALNAQERARLPEQLERLGIKVWPSIGNFLLLDFSTQTRVSAERADALLREQGIILRRMESYGLGHCLRMTIGRPEQNTRVLEAFAKIFVA